MDHKRLGVRMLLSMTLLLTSAFVRELCPVRVSFKQTILSHTLTSSNAERKLSDPGEHLKEPIPLLAFFDNAANDQSIQIRNYCLQTRESPPRRRGFPIYHECWQISVEMRRKRYISTSCHNSYCKKISLLAQIKSISTLLLTWQWLGQNSNYIIFLIYLFLLKSRLIIELFHQLDHTKYDI